MTPIVITPPAAPLVSLDEAKKHLRVDFSDDDALITAMIETARAWIDAPEGKLNRALITQTLELRLWHFSHLYSHYNPLEKGFGDQGCVDRLDGFRPDGPFYSNMVRLPLPKLIGVDTVKYLDTDGTLQTLDSSLWRAFGIGGRGQVAPAFGTAWPATRWELEAVRIQYRAGYGPEATDVPAPIRHAVLLLIGHLYENREAEVVGTRAAAIELPTGVNALLSPYMVYD